MTGTLRRRTQKTKVADVNSFTGVKVFSATGSEERAQLGEKVTAWMLAASHLRFVDKAVLQSSDASHHCLSVWLFYVDESARRGGTGATPVSATHQS
jgi:hypothetical protein